MLFLPLIRGLGKYAKGGSENDQY